MIDTVDRSAPLVSVIIPAHNACTTLERALRSVISQTYRPLEIIIVDDASVDGTGDIARNFDGLPVRVETLDQQSGAAAARNRGIAVSSGEYIAFLDADDEWLPDKTALQLDLLVKNPDVSFVTCDSDLVGPDGEFISIVNPNRPRPHGPEAWKTLLHHPCVATPCVVVRRSLLRDIGGFNPDLLIGEDQDLWIRLALRGPVYHLSQSLARVNDRPNSLSKAQRGQAVSSTLPMIVAHVKAQRDRLSDEEAEDILGTRYTDIGRTSYETGSVKEGVRLLVSAIRLGHRPIENLSYLLSASPPMRMAKRVVGYDRSLPVGLRFSTLDPHAPPLLAVVVDTEEEFDWEHPFNSGDRGVTSINYLPLAQRVHEKHGIVPTYVVDYPVVDDANAVSVIKKFVDDGKALVGAHLQPWVNPPFEETEEMVNTFPGNLSYSLEYRKLTLLSEMIEKRFERRPVVYKAGRYGLGPATAKILKSLGYEIDASVLPYTNLRYRGGPDFSSFPDLPFWFGEGMDLFEVPLTRGFTGLLRRFGPSVSPLLDHPSVKRLHLVGACARLGLLERITLTPEGMSLEEQKRLTRVLLKQGRRVFAFTYHSSSLLPGATQYVRTRTDRDAFLEKMDRYFEFFTKEIGGKPATLNEIRDLSRGSKGQKSASKLGCAAEAAVLPTS